MEYLEMFWMSGSIDIDETIEFTSNTSPGQTDLETAIWAHGNQFLYNKPAFFLGGMIYEMTVKSDGIEVTVTNEFSISSGVMKDNGKSNLVRKSDGSPSPLGNTKQIFKFTLKFNSGGPPTQWK